MVYAGSAGGATKRAVLKLLQQEPLKSVASIIVYCTFQAQADEVARYLYTQGVSALAYHAGKSFKVVATAKIPPTPPPKPVLGGSASACVFHCGP